MTIGPGSAAGPGRRAPGPYRRGAHGATGLVATDVGTERPPTRTAMESLRNHRNPWQRPRNRVTGPRGQYRGEGPPGPRA